MKPLLALLEVELRLLLRRGESVLVTLALPPALLAFFATVGPAERTPAEGLRFLVPGVLALAVMSTGLLSLGIAAAFERSYGVLKRLLGSPLPLPTLLAARTLAVLLLEALQVTTVVGAAALLGGWSPEGSLGLGGLCLALGSVAFAGLGLLLAGTLRAEATLAAANGLFLAMLLLGGMVVPLEALPDALAGVARLLPGTALADATRGALNNGTVPQPTLITLVAWAVGAPLAAAFTFRPE